MPTALISQPVYGLPGGGAQLTIFRRAVASYRPLLFFKCDEPSGVTSLSDYLAQMTMTKINTPASGGASLASGERASAVVTGSSAWIGSTRDPGSGGATIGCIWRDTGSGADQFYWGAWNGSGFGLGNPSGTAQIGLFVAGSRTSGVSVAGTHLWIGTWDTSNMRLYKDGVLVAGPTGSTWSMGTPAWGINCYSGSPRNASGQASDCFLIPQALTATQVAALAALTGLNG